jgi:hypothetical protein
MMQSSLQIRIRMGPEPKLYARLHICERFDDHARVGPHFPFGRPQQKFHGAFGTQLAI